MKSVIITTDTFNELINDDIAYVPTIRFDIADENDYRILEKICEENKINIFILNRFDDDKDEEN